jgi:hypothetical protein
MMTQAAMHSVVHLCLMGALTPIEILTRRLGRLGSADSACKAARHGSDLRIPSLSTGCGTVSFLCCGIGYWPFLDSCALYIIFVAPVECQGLV